MTDQTLTTGRSLSEFTAQPASAQPAPGGGGAAALTGALAASLAAMAANVTAANPRYAGRHDALTTLAAACETQRRALRVTGCGQRRERVRALGIAGVRGRHVRGHRG